MSHVEEKSPEEIINYSFNWATFLAGDLIASSAWSVSPGDISDPQSSLASSQTLTTVLLSGGKSGLVYFMKNTVQTAAGLEFSATMRLYIVDNNFLN